MDVGGALPHHHLANGQPKRLKRSLGFYNKGVLREYPGRRRGIEDKDPGLPLSSFTVAAAARRSWIDGRTGTTQRSEASIASLAVRSPGVSMKTHWRLVALMIVPTSRGVDLAHSGRGRVSGLDWNHCDTLA